MAVIGKWNNHTFEVSSHVVRGFTGLTIRGSSEIEDKTSNSEKYVSRKNANPTEISLTVGLNALTGCDVRNEAMAFVEDARCGAKGYFYIGGKKLVTCQLMLTEASVDETEISAGGKWTKCSVKLTMKQCTKIDGSTGGTGSSGSGGGSSGGGSSAKKKSSTKKSVKKTSVIGAVAGAVAGIAGAVVAVASKAGALKSAVSSVKKVQNNAKKTSAPSKKKVTKTVKPKSKFVRNMLK